MLSEDWKQAFLKLLDETLETWTGAFDGTPEAQMHALEVLSDTRDAVSRGNANVASGMINIVFLPKGEDRNKLMRLFADGIDVNDHVLRCQTNELSAQSKRKEQTNG